MKNDFIMYMGGRIRTVLENADKEMFEDVREIRLRADKPLILKKENRDIFLNASGVATNIYSAFKPSAKDIMLTTEILGGYYKSAFDEEMKHGFITIEGGHRVGICGKAVLDKGDIKTIRNVSSLNLRIARQVKGCAREALRYISARENIYNTLIISPPGGGKTTILRDIIRSLSDGFEGFEGKNIGVCDERSEIGASFRGRVKNDIGIRTDIIDGCPKSKGMMMLLRSMAPEIIAADEIGTDEDIEAIKKAIVSGVKLICTAHAEGIEDAVRFKNIFERFIVLYGPDKAGKIKAIYDSDFKEIYINGS